MKNRRTKKTIVLKSLRTCFGSRLEQIPGVQKRQSVAAAFECRGRTVLAESLVSPPSTVTWLRRRQLLVRHGLRPQVELLSVLVKRLQIVKVIKWKEISRELSFNN